MDLQAGMYRDKKDVIEKYVKPILLPLLNIETGGEAGVRITHSGLLMGRMLKLLLPLPGCSAEKAEIVLLASNPGKITDKALSKLMALMDYLRSSFGILTDGLEVRVYKRGEGGDKELIIQAVGDEINDKAEDLKVLFARGEKPADLDPEGGNHDRAPSAYELPAEPLQNAAPTILPVAAAAMNNANPQEDPLPSWEEEPPSNEEDFPLPWQIPSSPEEGKKSMTTIAVYHNKGGVGKTTVAVNLSAALKRKGYRVLTIDMDAQANATFAAGLIKFEFEEDDDIRENYVYHVLKSGEYHFIPDVLRRSKGFNTPEIDFIPSHIDLTNHQHELIQIATSRSRLSVKLKKVEDQYDFVIIDTPPSRDLYAEISLSTADYLLIPSDLRPFANQGLKNVRNFVDVINENRRYSGHDPLKVLGVLPSKISTNYQYLKHSFPRQKSAITNFYSFPLMETVIHERMPLAFSLSRTRKEGEVEIPDPKSIFDYSVLEPSDSAEQAAADFLTLADEILKKTEWI